MTELKPGDVFEVRDGMTVYTLVPERFVFSNSPFSTKDHERDIQVGHTYTAAKADFKQIAKDLVEKFDWKLGEGAISARDIETFLKAKLKPAGSDTWTSGHLRGEYVVVRAGMEGGNHHSFDPSPDYWHVTARKLRDGRYDPKGIEISFYQSGCKSKKYLLPDIPVIRTMHQTFVEARP